ncbi:MAG TPA: FAD-binding oxidoreductase [Acidimicrobiia bacterium]|nr:FAD-binding oxidoreductase [Acidimicrobiia bacterium]
MVVVGGGVVGLSVAWHLLESGVQDVTVLERDRLGCGTTWHSAGHITWMPSPGIAAPIDYMIELVQKLTEETGQNTGWRRTGRLFLATNEKAMTAWERQHSMAAELGVHGQLLDPMDVRDHLPIVDPSAIVGAWLNPVSGRVNPTDLVAAYARGIRSRGGKLIEACPVNEIRVTDSAISGVATPRGPFEADAVVVCAGIWSRRLLATAGLAVAHGACEHLYALAEMEPPLPQGLPDFSCPEYLIYGREEVGGVMVGFFDENAKHIELEHFPDDFSFGLLAENWEQVASYYQNAIRIFPRLEEAPVRLVNGPEAFTPDGLPLVGSVPGVNGLLVACGMNSSGVEYSGMVGSMVADQITGAEPRFRYDYRPARFDRDQNDPGTIDSQMPDAPSSFYRAYFAS